MNTPLEDAAGFRWNGKQWESPLGIRMNSGACSVLNEAIEEWHAQELSKAVNEVLRAVEGNNRIASMFNPNTYVVKLSTIQAERQRFNNGDKTSSL